MNANKKAYIGRSRPRISLYDWTLRLIVTVLRSYRIFRVTARQYRELNDLPDHLLRDVGLERHQVARARREHQFQMQWVYWP